MIAHELSALLGDYREIPSSGELNFCCPFCLKRIGKVDKGYHLYVNPDAWVHNIRGWYYCQRCHARGPMARLLGKETEEHKPNVRRWKDRVKEALTARAPREKRVVELPRDYVEMIRGTEAYEYLERRHITDEEIAHYQLGFGTEDLREIPSNERRYYAGSGRIVFPDFDSEGDCCYWVARTYKGHKVKYKNPGASDAGFTVYNLARAVCYRDVVITEGVISAIAAGRNAIATYGKNVTACQVRMLAEAAFERYIVALDGDARPEACALAEQLHRRGCTSLLVRFGQEEDPASVEDIKRRIDLAEPYTWSSRMTFVLSK